jgi:hypothetical protein
MGGELLNESAISRRDWSLGRWLLGVCGLLISFGYMGLWYLVFSLPLMVLMLSIIVGATLLLEDNTQAVRVLMFLVSPFAVVLLVWQVIRFIGPAYFGLLKSVGCFLHRAHLHTPTELLGLVRTHRKNASNDIRLLWRRISGD